MAEMFFDEYARARLEGTYTIIGPLGSGGTASVMLARHIRLQKDVVIKKTRAFVRDESRMRREVDILKNLRHSYLPQVLDYFVIGGYAYTVMDYIPGNTLFSIVSSKGRLPEDKVIKYARQLCEAVNYLHSQLVPIIHGDIKPENVIITPEDNICLIDFNISGISKDGKAYTYGYTDGYSAPEQYTAFVELRDRIRNSGGSSYQSFNTPAPVAPVSRPTHGGTEILPPSGYDVTEVIPGNTVPEEIPYSNEPPSGYVEFGSPAAGEPRSSYVEFPQGRSAGSGAPVPVPPAPDVSGQGGIPIDVRSDIYSIGATLFFIYAGRKFDPNINVTLGSDANEGLIHIINRALSQKPSGRYQSAGEMQNALDNLYRRDGGYKSLVVGYNIKRTILAVLIAVGVIMIFSGLSVMKKEKLSQYDSLIKKMEKARNTGDEQALDNAYEEAVSLFPERAEAYYEYAAFYYDSGRYDEAVFFISEDVERIRGLGPDVYVADIDYVLGASLLETKDYEGAAEAFEKAIELNDGESSYYTGLASAMIASGDVKEAGKILEEAKDNGIEDAAVSLIEGKILFEKGEYKKADSDLRYAMEYAEDDSMLYEAAVMLAKNETCADTGEQGLKRSVNVLEDASQQLPAKYTASLYEKAAQSAIDGYGRYGTDWFKDHAVKNLKGIIDLKMDSAVTYDSLISIYHLAGDFDEERSVIEMMEKKYPGDYVVYKRKAFLELSVQGGKDESQRDYEPFREYYNKANELYDGSGDPEMGLLDDLYGDLRAGRWLS